MSGINVVQTGKDVGAFFNSWMTYLNAAHQYKNNPNDSAAQSGLNSAALGLSSAISTLGKNPTLASTLGTLAGVTDIQNQVAAYQAAVAAGRPNAQTAALSSIAGDSASIAGTTATAIGALATQAGNSELASLMGEVAEHANDFGLAVGTVGTAVDVGNWFNSTFLPGFNQWIGNTPPQLDGDMLLNMNDPGGNSVIIMPGQTGDTLADTPLSGGALQYTESNPQGTVTSTVQLAYNGSVDDLIVTGAGVVADVGGFQINLANSTSMTVSGSKDNIQESAGDYLVANGGGNTISGAAGAQTFITGTNGVFDTVNVNGEQSGGKTANGQPTGILFSTNAQANINGSNNGINDAAGDSVGVYGGGNTINAAVGALTIVGNTNGNFDLVNANGVQFGGFAANGQGTGIGISANSQANVVGNSNGVNVNTGDSVGVYGGGNTVNAAAGAFTVLGNTNGAFDLVNANGDAFNGPVSGIYLNSNAQANIFGSGNGVGEAAGDSVGVYGGGNTVNAAAGAFTVLGNTNGAFDLVNANGDAFNGPVSGIYLNGNAQANIFGSGNGVGEAAGDAVGVYGGSNTINAAIGALTVLGNTGGNLDLVNANGVQFGGLTANGQGTGIAINANSGAVVDGSNSGISENAGDYLIANGGGNTIDAVAGSQAYLTGTNGSFDMVNANGVQLGGITFNGQPTGILFSTNAQANINGSNNGINNAAGDSVGVYGGGNTINAAAGALTVIGNTNGNYDRINANGDQNGGLTANGQGTGIGLNANSQANIFGSSNGITLGNSASAIVAGNSNTVNTDVNAAVAVNGTGNIVNASSHSVVLDNGVNNTINATNSVIQVGSQNIGQTVYINGNGNSIDASTLFWQGPSQQTTIVVRGTGNTIYANPGATKIDLNNTTGNFVVGQSVAVYTNNANSFTRGAGLALSGTYGPLNPTGASNPGVYFPDYNPSVGGTGGSFSNGGVWNGGDPAISMPAYDLPLDDCGSGSYNPDGTFNVVVCGAGLGGAAPASFSALSAQQVQSPVASTATSSSGVGAPVTHAMLLDPQEGTAPPGVSGPADSDASTPDVLDAIYQGQGQAATTNPASGVITDTTVQSLIAALASFGADSSASSAIATPAQNDPQMLLAASAY
jgi:hypothetical protein